jgi:hypothetical protein
MEVHRCFDAGAYESAVLPLADSLAIAGAIDHARAAIDLRNSGEVTSEA